MPKKVPRDSESKVTIKIPRNLYNHLQEVITGSGFDSVTDFTVYVLRDLASGGVAKNLKPQPRKEDAFTPEEVEAIRQRLKNLGYL
jgi:hypothetical protein